MKKILAVLIAISMVATMAFAADVNFSVDFAAKGNVVKVDDLSKAVDTATWLNETQDEQDAWNPPMWGGTGYDMNVVATTADDKAGAALMFYNDKDFKYTGSLWIKPIDMLKLSFFSASEKLFTEAISGDDILKTAGDYGVTLTPIAGLTIDIVTEKDIKDGSNPLFGGKITYAIDGVATIVANGNDDDQYGAGVNGISVGPISSAEAYYIYNKGASNVYENATVAVGPVTLFEEVKLNNLDTTLVAPTYVKVSGKVADVSLACVAEWADVQKADKLTVTPSAEIGGNAGAAAWTLGCELPVDMTGTETVVGLAIPYSVKLSY